MSAGARLGLWALAVLGGAGLLTSLVGRIFVVPVDMRDVGGTLAWVGASMVPVYLLGVLLVRLRPAHPGAWRLLLMGTALAVGEAVWLPLELALRDGAPLPGWWVTLNLISQELTLLTIIAAIGLFGLYPNGTGERPWHDRVVRWSWALLALPLVLLVSVDHQVIPAWWQPDLTAPSNPAAVPALAPLGVMADFLFVSSLPALLGPVLLLLRYTRAGTEDRRLMRLMLVIGGVGFAGLVVDSVGRSLGVTMWLWSILYGLTMVLIPVAIAIGVLRHNVLDIDLAVRRAVVYTSLSIGIATVYVLLAAGPGLALGRSIPVEAAVILTIVAALAFQPVRRWLTARADRWVYGERVNRYRLLIDLGEHLDRSVHDVLPTLASTVARGLRARWVRVSLRGSDDDWLAEPVGLAGIPDGDPVLVQPMEHRGEVVGRIECGPGEEPYTAADEELLGTVAAQAAVAIANTRLTAQLADRLEELERSRSRIVAAQDAERRRLERDIHDGVQQDVVALLLRTGLARNRLARGEADADDVLAEIQKDAGALLADLRELARGIQPPVLADRGLLAAVEDRVSRLPVPVRLHTDVRDRRFGEDVETAAYLIVCEALTNVVKHAGARAVDVELVSRDHVLSIDVHDDGAGFDVGAGGGMGLLNLRDRVEALGGTLRIASASGAGTDLRAELPLERAA